MRRDVAMGFSWRYMKMEVVARVMVVHAPNPRMWKAEEANLC